MRLTQLGHTTGVKHSVMPCWSCGSVEHFQRDCSSSGSSSSWGASKKSVKAAWRQQRWGQWTNDWEKQRGKVEDDRDETESLIQINSSIAANRGMLSGLNGVKGAFAAEQRTKLQKLQKDLYATKSRRKVPSERLVVVEALIEKSQEKSARNAAQIEALQEVERLNLGEHEEFLVEKRGLEARIAEEEERERMLHEEVDQCESASKAEGSFQQVSPTQQGVADIVARLSSLNPAALQSLKEVLGIAGGPPAAPGASGPPVDTALASGGADASARGVSTPLRSAVAPASPGSSGATEVSPAHPWTRGPPVDTVLASGAPPPGAIPEMPVGSGIGNADTVLDDGYGDCFEGEEQVDDEGMDQVELDETGQPKKRGSKLQPFSRERRVPRKPGDVLKTPSGIVKGSR